MRHLKEVNVDSRKTDQSGYMYYAKKMYETKYSFVGHRNQMPLYPFLQSLLLFMNPGLDDHEYFVQRGGYHLSGVYYNPEFFVWGKYLNVILSVVILAGLFLIFRNYLPIFQAVNLILITAFTVFIFKAAYFQADLLFYFLNFCGFLLMLRMLSQPSWVWGILTGVVLGLAHLTKASILPGLVLFVLFFAAKETYVLYQRGTGKYGTSLRNESGFISRWLSIALLVLFFLGTVYPYINTSKRVFGSYFYNVNSTFYMWYDSFKEAKKGTRAHGDRIGWPKMPAELIPGPKKYLQEHTTKQILSRVFKGLKRVISNCINSYGYFKYALVYFVFFLILVVLNFRESVKMAANNFILLSFCILYFFTYLLLYAWYAPIAAGNRLILGQFLPFMFVISVIISLPSFKRLSLDIWGVRIKWFYAINTFILVMFIVDLYLILTKRIVTMYGGS
ncbi:MAG TPA: glycosyltransferase family 39 protein [Thermodesulfobacteriota bacterium]|nr:glycosyltransferase family 39 protein [Thermodesulfobacteriota bacterium]